MDTPTSWEASTELCGDWPRPVSYSFAAYLYPLNSCGGHLSDFVRIPGLANARLSGIFGIPPPPRRREFNINLWTVIGGSDSPPLPVTPLDTLSAGASPSVATAVATLPHRRRLVGVRSSGPNSSVRSTTIRVVEVDLDTERSHPCASLFKYLNIGSSRSQRSPRDSIPSFLPRCQCSIQQVPYAS